MQTHTNHFQVDFSIVELRGVPLPLVSWRTGFVHVVQFCIQGEASVGGEAQPKQAPLVALLCATSERSVGDVAGRVFALELHVHHKLLLLHIDAQPFALLGRLLIHLHVLYHIVGQVVEHHPVVALEEVLAIECEVINLASVDEYLSVVLQLHAWQLLDECIEHTPLGHIEGIGIECYCVASIYDFHLCSLYHHFIEEMLKVGLLLF